MAPLPSNEVWYNVKTYGAVGNGTTDDTAAIQSTIDAAFADGGGTVFFPAGTYRVTATIQTGYRVYCLLVRSKIILKGASRDASIIKLANNQPQDCRIIANYNQQSGGDESIAFEDFTIDGNANNQGTVTAMVGISCVRTQHVRHNRLSIKNIKGVLPVNTQPSGEGVHFDSYSSSHNSYTDCEATQT